MGEPTDAMLRLWTKVAKTEAEDRGARLPGETARMIAEDAIAQHPHFTARCEFIAANIARRRASQGAQ